MKDKNLYFAVFISGFCLMVVEIAGTRVLAPYLGATIFLWASIIATLLGALSIGYYLGGGIADKNPSEKELGKIFMVAGICTLLVPSAGKIIGESTFYLPVAAASIVASLIFLPAGIFYGMVSPFAIKLASEKRSEGRTAGNIFALSTVGSITGALATAFILIPGIKITLIFMLAAIAMFSSSLAIYRIRIDKRLIAAILAVAALNEILPSVNAYGKTVAEFETPYYHVQVIDRIESGQQQRLLFLDRDSSTGIDLDTNESIFNYVKKTELGYELVENPERALVIGVAGGSYLAQLRAKFPDIEIYGIDIDEKVVTVARSLFSLKEDGKTRIIINDARRELSGNKNSYDLVIIDAYRGNGMPYHLLSLEFFGLVKARMKENGVLTINVISSLSGERAGAFEFAYNTLSREFRNVVAMPIEKDSPAELQNIIIIATDKNTDQFISEHSFEIYQPVLTSGPPATDELNPSELFVTRN